MRERMNIVLLNKTNASYQKKNKLENPIFFWEKKFE